MMNIEEYQAKFNGSILTDKRLWPLKYGTFPSSDNLDALSTRFQDTSIKNRQLDKAKKFTKYAQVKRLPRKLKKSLRKDPSWPVFNKTRLLTFNYSENLIGKLTNV